METATKTTIQVSDLRIGNWLITYAAALPQYFKITSWHIKYFDENGFRDESPIPLTPELLEKNCGFKNGLLINFEKSIKIKVSSIDPIAYVGNATDTSGVAIKNIQFLHQLQNLYFALTQTELPITL